MKKRKNKSSILIIDEAEMKKYSESWKKPL